MQHAPEHLPPSTPLLWLRAGVAAALLCMVFSLALAKPAVAADAEAVRSALDGKTYQSRLGIRGQPADIDDLLVFEDGEFVSEECERRCGYAKVEYWVRAQDDAIQMRADVPCTESGAVMYWRGTVRGDEIEGSILWVNKRWYWTFEKELWFKGRLVEADAP